MFVLLSVGFLKHKNVNFPYFLKEIMKYVFVYRASV